MSHQHLTFMGYVVIYIYCKRGLNWHIAFMNIVICWFIANPGITEVVCQQHELDRYIACLDIIICRFLAISGLPKSYVNSMSWTDI